MPLCCKSQNKGWYRERWRKGEGKGEAGGRPYSSAEPLTQPCSEHFNVQSQSFVLPIKIRRKVSVICNMTLSNEQINKMWSLHTLKNHSAMKRSEARTLTRTLGGPRTHEAPQRSRHERPRRDSMYGTRPEQAQPGWVSGCRGGGGAFWCDKNVLELDRGGGCTTL